jgi:hypothetical protein
MSTKDDPLAAGAVVGGRTLWLDGTNVETARDNFWQAYQRHRGREALHDEADHKTWDIAWAAAIGAYTYLMEGRVEPR